VALGWAERLTSLIGFGLRRQTASRGCSMLFVYSISLVLWAILFVFSFAGLERHAPFDLRWWLADSQLAIDSKMQMLLRT